MAGRYEGDGKWKELLKVVEAAGERSVKVGVLASKGGDAVHVSADGESDGLTLLELAVIHELGSEAANIPERSFIRLTIAALEEEIGEVMAKLARAVVEKGMPIDQALNILGAYIATEIKKTISGGGLVTPLWEELKPATIARKGSDRPLVDTGQLLNAITWEVGPRGTGA